MPVPSDPYNFTNGTTADGDQVDARFAPLYAALDHALDDDNVASFTSAVLKLSVGRVQPSADVTLTTGAPGPKTDLCSLSITPSVASKLLVVQHVAVAGSNGAGSAESWMNVDGTDRVDSSPPVASLGAIVTTGDYTTLVAADVLDLTAAAHTVKLRARWNGAGIVSAQRQGSGFAYLLVAA